MLAFIIRHDFNPCFKILPRNIKLANLDFHVKYMKIIREFWLKIIREFWLKIIGEFKVMIHRQFAIYWVQKAR